MVTKAQRLLFLVSFLLLSACQAPSVNAKASGEGYGGGDPIVALVTNARTAAAATLRGIQAGEQNGVVAHGTCDIPLCVGSYCEALNALSDAEKAALASLLEGGLAGEMAALLDDASVFRITNEVLYHDGRPVVALAKLGGREIWIYGPGVAKMHSRDLMALIAHEATHAVPAYVENEELAYRLGGCVQLTEEEGRLARNRAPLPKALVEGFVEQVPAGSPLAAQTPSNPQADSATEPPPSAATPSPSSQVVPAPSAAVPALPATLPSPPPLPPGFPLPSGTGTFPL